VVHSWKAFNGDEDQPVFVSILILDRIPVQLAAVAAATG
jgi:hypothetical protein